MSDKSYWEEQAKVIDFLNDIDTFNPFGFNNDQVITGDVKEDKVDCGNLTYSRYDF